MAVADVLRSIHRIEDVSRLCGALGYHPHWRELPAGWLRDAPAGAVVARQGDFEWYAVLGANISATRRLARGLGARGLPSAVVSLDRASRRLLVAAADAAPLALSLESPDPLGLARLARCGARPGELALATAFRIAEALESRGVDDRFFTGFRRVLGELTGALPARISLTDRHALALLQLTRILFLYFVEAKGWLDQRPRFLRDQVDHCLSARRSLQRDLLAPLFFGTLNRPFPERSALARRFGAVPFLNGGLFEPHPLERRWRITVPTPVLREAFDSLFERFHFTLGAGSGESIAPDMLGRVFEGVMEPGERHGTGSYYTPAALVDAILRDALAVRLEGSLGCTWCEARRRVDDPDPFTRRAFRSFRLLDPAVGSGAFLLGALRLLAGPDSERGARRAARLRGILGRSLFGVDRNAAAVRLAELRLWLEVVAAEPSDRPDSVEPLPNLDALVRQGDSLVDPTWGIPVPPPRGSRAASLGSLRIAVVGATGREKQAAISALLRAEREVAEVGLGGALDKVDAEVTSLLELARSPNLFGGRRGLDAAGRTRLGELRAARRRTRDTLRSLRSAGEVPWFHYPVHFADVFADGGFDLVVGNPPWVRAEALPPSLRRYLSERFRWFRRTRDRGRGYVHQPDLAVGFLERALELAAPGGVVAFLLPAKLATTGYAARARDELSRRTTIAVAADLRTDPRAAFDATVYPMAVIARKAAPSSDHRVRLGLGAEATGSVPQRALGAGPWVLVPDSTRAVLEQLHATGPALGDRFECHLGVKTGLNRVFLDPPEDVEPELVRWAARGRDVRAFRVRAVRKILWTCDAAGRALDTLPPAAARHLAAHTGALRRRADHHGGRSWTLFRTRAASAPHRVIWADVARRLEAAALSGPLGARIIPLNTCYVLPARDEPMALRLAAWLNCTWLRAAAAAVADPASSGFARFNARVVGSLPCPATALEDPMLLDLGRAAASAAFPRRSSMNGVPRSSIWTRAGAMRWPSWLTTAPCLVAEALVRVPDPLRAWIRPLPPAPAGAVAAALARALLPPIASDPSPVWLRDDQELSFRRALAAVRRHGGALLADGVGTGKTYIALAVAAALDPGRRIHVFAPAALLSQWREAARRVALEILPLSHETMSRGRGPSMERGPAIIDESHRFRTPGTRRYGCLVPWCVGRRGLLLTATPAVNRLEDVTHQLLLFVRDDALGGLGLASLRDDAPYHAALLAHLIVTGEDRSALLPARANSDIRMDEPAASPGDEIRRGILGLGLSGDPAIASLIRVALLYALASSPVAVADSLARYRSLLLHASDAAASGRAISRHAIRRMVGPGGDQLVLWPLVAEGLAAPELLLEDLEAVLALERRARAWSLTADRKVEALARLSADRKPTLVFATATATVRHIRRHLGRRRIAWCTGSGAGVDSMPVPRDDVLDWFRRPILPGDGVASRPDLLVATDVAAEGLDLPLIARVVHYDLPWTAVRLDQRSGRALRLGTQHDRVEVIRLLPPVALEDALHLEEILRDKAGLPAQLGLGDHADAPWRLRARIPARHWNRTPMEGIAACRGEVPAAVAGVRIRAEGGFFHDVVLARVGAGSRWTDDAATIAGLLDSARSGGKPLPPSKAAVRGILRALAPEIRRALRITRGAPGPRPLPASVGRALRRILGLARQAAGRRSQERLALLGRGIGFLRRGHTAGEQLLIERWNALSAGELMGNLARLPPEPILRVSESIELIGLILVEGAPKSG